MPDVIGMKSRIPRNTQTVIYHCDPDDSETISSEFDREVDNHYYSMKEKFEKISEFLKE